MTEAHISRYAFALPARMPAACGPATRQSGEAGRLHVYFSTRFPADKPHTAGLPDRRQVSRDSFFYRTAKDAGNRAPQMLTYTLEFEPGTTFPAAGNGGVWSSVEKREPFEMKATTEYLLDEIKKEWPSAERRK